MGQKKFRYLSSRLLAAGTAAALLNTALLAALLWAAVLWILRPFCRLERNTRLPASKVRRIANTHMEVNRLCDWLKGQDLSRCREIHLLHLSNANSNEGLFVDLVERVVPRHVRVTACGK